MKLNNLRALVKEELNKKLNEEYQDKFKMVGMLISNIKQRPQKEIYSDIRAITGISVISSKEPNGLIRLTVKSQKGILTSSKNTIITIDETDPTSISTELVAI